MKHLLLVSFYLTPRAFGGSSVVAEEVSRIMARSGEWKVTYLSASYYGTVGEAAIIRTQMPGGEDHFTVNFGGFRSKDQEFENHVVTAALTQLVERIKPDAAHLHCVQNLGIGLFDTLHRANVPMVLSTHDYWWLCERIFMHNNAGVFCDQEDIDRKVCKTCVMEPKTLDWRWSRGMDTLKKPRFVTYPSAYARSMYERNGAPVENGVVVPNGVAHPGPDYAALRAANPSRRLRFGYIGGPGPLKGWSMIEKAAAAFGPDQIEIKVVDAATHIGGAWWETYDFGAISDHVTIVPGYTMATVDEFFAGLDVLLFLSTWRETFGLTTREAALRGVHVLATDCGAPIEHLIDGDTATILPGLGAVDDLKAAMGRLVADGPPAPSEAGLTKIADTVRTYEEQAAEINALLNRAIAASASAPDAAAEAAPA